MGQAVRTALTACPLQIREKHKPQGGFTAFHLLWPADAGRSLAGEDQGRARTPSAVIGCLTDVLGLAQNF